MSVRIRVYPQNGLLGANGLNGLGTGAVSASTYFNSKLQTQQQVSKLQLGYERALSNERIERVRLEERLKNPYAAMSGGVGGAYALPVNAGYGGIAGLAGIAGLGGIGGYNAGIPVGGLPIGGFPTGGLPMGGVPAGFAGSGQTNSTNQVTTGGANQSVTNSNVMNVSSSQTAAPYGYGGFAQQPYGSGGFLSGLLGALI